MYFSQKEKQAIVRLVNLMTIADGKVDAEEIVHSIAIFSQLGVSRDDIENADHLDDQETLRIISNMQPDLKRIVVAILGRIMISDDIIDEKEQVLINLITILCNLPVLSLGEAIAELNKL